MLKKKMLMEDVALNGRIGIITLNGYFNYGNRLQNYATQEIVKSLGYTAMTLIVDTKENSVEKNDEWINQRKKRTDIFKEFSQRYINESNFSISEENIPNDLVDGFDYFVTGSDQVWNPVFRRGSSLEFLTFAPKNKRIAFAPSFGVNEILSPEYRQNYSLWLSQIPSLSVREQAGADIIKELTGRDAQVLVDPTLVLTKEKWLSIAKKHKNKPEKKYILTYFLGDINEEKEAQINFVSKKYNLEIVNLARVNEDAYLTGPSEFIDYINSASLVYTDSFHGAVFSILLDTPFIVFNRIDKLHSMNSRIDTLLATFNLESRLADNMSNKNIFEVNFSNLSNILETERNKSLNYLKDAFGIG